MSILLIIILFSWYLQPKDLGEDDLRRFKGIASAEIPISCLSDRDDVCALFDCMVDYCWCDEMFPSSILIEGTTIISNEEEAMNTVKQVSGYEVKRAVKLNNVFYNVFTNAGGGEKVYTVAADGTIMKTMCGV